MAGSLTRRRAPLDAAVADSCLALAGELRAGTPTRQAFAVIAEGWPDLYGSAAGRLAVGDPPGRVLRDIARQPGAETLGAVAAAWDVSERTGASLSAVLVAVADSLRAEATVRREADAQLASVRATSRIMAVLPVLTLLLFSAGDGAAVRFLTTTAYGLACLVMAGMLVVAGLVWVGRASRGVRSAWAT